MISLESLGQPCPAASSGQPGGCGGIGLSGGEPAGGFSSFLDAAAGKEITSTPRRDGHSSSRSHGQPAATAIPKAAPEAPGGGLERAGEADLEAAVEEAGPSATTAEETDSSNTTFHCAAPPALPSVPPEAIEETPSAHDSAGARESDARNDSPGPAAELPVLETANSAPSTEVLPGVADRTAAHAEPAAANQATPADPARTGEDRVRNRQSGPSGADLGRAGEAGKRFAGGVKSAEEEGKLMHGMDVAESGTEMNGFSNWNEFAGRPETVAAVIEPAGGAAAHGIPEFAPEGLDVRLPAEHDFFRNGFEMEAARPGVYSRQAAGEMMAGRLEPLVAAEVRILRQMQAGVLSVVVRPDAGTEISLQLTLKNGGVEASAHCERGDLQALREQWSQLQQNLSRQGIRLAPLAESADAARAGSGDFGSGARSSGGGRGGSGSRSEPGWPGEWLAPSDAPVRLADGGGSHGRAVRRAWEMWA